MLAKNAESSLADLGCRLIRQPRQLINSETEFAKASQGPADEFIVRVILAKLVDSQDKKKHDKAIFGNFQNVHDSITDFQLLLLFFKS